MTNPQVDRRSIYIGVAWGAPLIVGAAVVWAIWVTAPDWATKSLGIFSTVTSVGFTLLGCCLTFKLKDISPSWKHSLRTAMVPVVNTLVALGLAWVLTLGARRGLNDDLNSSFMDFLFIAPALQVFDLYDRGRTLWSEYAKEALAQRRRATAHRLVTDTNTEKDV